MGGVLTPITPSSVRHCYNLQLLVCKKLRYCSLANFIDFAEKYHWYEVDRNISLGYPLINWQCIVGDQDEMQNVPRASNRVEEGRVADYGVWGVS